ncbi:MAG: hypothetical protein KC421_07140 [Anaerolineales bacterium]|nr:hypothetical protein [Anaerolineales bacterium]
MRETTKTYISFEEWARILSETWLDPEFKVAVETDPATAICERFPEIEFERVYHIPPRPDHVTDEELWKVVKGEEPAFPDVDGNTHAFV